MKVQGDLITKYLIYICIFLSIISLTKQKLILRMLGLLTFSQGYFFVGF